MTNISIYINYISILFLRYFGAVFKKIIFPDFKKHNMWIYYACSEPTAVLLVNKLRTTAVINDPDYISVLLRDPNDL